MASNQYSVRIDTNKLLQVIGTVEWFVRTGKITYDDALVILHAAVNDAVTNENLGTKPPSQSSDS